MWSSSLYRKPILSCKWTFKQQYSSPSNSLQDRPPYFCHRHRGYHNRNPAIQSNTRNMGTLCFIPEEFDKLPETVLAKTREYHRQPNSHPLWCVDIVLYLSVYQRRLVGRKGSRSRNAFNIHCNSWLLHGPHSLTCA